MSNADILDELYQVIKARKGADPETSYTARLFAAGDAKVAQKVGEEAIETVVAGLAESHGDLVYESADLLYHLLVFWAQKGVDPAEVYDELKKRRREMGAT